MQPAMRSERHAASRNHLLAPRHWIYMEGFETFARELTSRLKARGCARAAAWTIFERRLDAELERLTELLFELYGARPDFAYWVEDLVERAFEAFKARPARLRARDARLPPESGWFRAQDVLGAVCYVDRWAGSFRGIYDRLPYLRELGIKYLHLMPFFKSPERENDGGYAVSSYRETNPQLGTMDELEELARRLEARGITLVADFVFNHSSDEHEWALAARAGDSFHRDFYLTFPDSSEPEEYSRTLREIFPEARRGSFTWCEEMNRWVWTTFHSYQWDLNYRNPAVFNAMASEMLALSNRGIGVLRLDAVAFVWKEKGTSCENLPQAHTIIRAFQAVARLSCPSLLFKSEAIVHPDDIAKYIDPRECQLSYNPLLMAELWEAAATKEVKLLAYSLAKRHDLPEGCAWVNYIRCHDDIGWTFADEDAAALGINGFDHRRFLNQFYLGEFPGSFARGLSFQYNPLTRDMRICGTAASLAGIERNMVRDPGKNRETSLRRLLLLYGIALSAGGLPLIYLGDELGVENDPAWDRDPAHAKDSRWVHRAVFPQALYEERHDSATVSGRVFSGMLKMIRARASRAVFAEPRLAVMESGHPSILMFVKEGADERLAVVGNFSERPARPCSSGWRALFSGTDGQGSELLSAKTCTENEAPVLEPCELLWISIRAAPGA